MKCLLLLALAAVTPLAEGQARPQMSEADAARHRIADYLAQGPAPWQPAPMGDSRTWRADFTVAIDGSGTHATVQSAIDAVPSRGASSTRHYIRVKPGVYRERVCVSGKAPITLYGDAADAAAATIVGGNYNAQSRRADADGAQTCDADAAAATFGTPGSATVAVFSDDFHAAHLTMENDAMSGVHDGIGYPPGAGESGGAQGVALMTRGDRLQLENVRLLGHQDTFHAGRRAPDTAARVYVHASLIAGDVDFIFGSATLVLDDCTIESRAGRRSPGAGGHVLAPSTPAGERLGFLVVGSRFVGEPGLVAGAVSLGRAWDEGVPRGGWQAGISPNGQALVRDSALGPHIGPWAASTSRRPFSADGDKANRMAEFRNRPLE